MAQVVLVLAVRVGRRRLLLVQSQLEGVAVPAGVLLAVVLGAAKDVVPATGPEVPVATVGTSQGAAVAKDERLDLVTGLVTWHVLAGAGLSTPVDAEGVVVVPAVSRHDVRLAVDQVGLGHQAGVGLILELATVLDAVATTEGATTLAVVLEAGAPVVPTRAMVVRKASLPLEAATATAAPAAKASPVPVPTAPTALPALAEAATPAPVRAAAPKVPTSSVPEVATTTSTHARVGLGVVAIPATEEATTTRRRLLVPVLRDARTEGHVVEGVTPLLVPSRPTDGDAATSKVLRTDHVATNVGAGAEAGALEVGMEAPVGKVGLAPTAPSGVTIGGEATAGVRARGIRVVVVPLGLTTGVPATIAAFGVAQVQVPVVVATETVVPLPVEDSRKSRRELSDAWGLSPFVVFIDNEGRRIKRRGVRFLL